MPGLTPSSPPPADDTRRGLVSTVAQTFAGAKTFLARIVATLGITSGLSRLDLRSDLGAGASDVCSVVGSTVADASVSATADLWSARTGIGGTEVQHARMVKGALIIDGSVAFGRFLSGRPGVSQGQVGHVLALAELGLYNLNGAGALALNLGTGSSRASGSFTAGGNLNSLAGVFAAGAGVSVDVRSALGAGASDVVSKVGTTLADASVNGAAKLLSVRTGLGGTEVEKVYWEKNGAYIGTYIRLPSDGSGHLDLGLCRQIGNNFSGNIFYSFNGSPNVIGLNTSTGRIDQRGTDSGAAPGAATADRPVGINAIASGASSVTITNSLVTATSRVLVTFHADHGAARWWVTRAAGSFTVVLSANATANAAFSWEVSTLL